MLMRGSVRNEWNLPIAQRLWVVVPAHNESRIISGCLDSIAAQIDTGLRLLVVDNVSTDDTREVVEGWFRSHPEIDGRVITENHKSAAAAADTGFRFAIDNGADWIARTDADCLVAPGWVAAVRRNSARAHMLGGRIRARGDDIRLRFSERMYLPTIVAAARLFGRMRPTNRSAEFLCPYVMCVGNNLAVEARTYEASGGFPRLAIEELPVPSDRALVNRVRQISSLVRYAPDMVVHNSIRRLRRYGLWRTLRWYANHSLDLDRFEIDVR
jgi:glycosyltransferase involved in cell wall biosynthesis